MTLSFQTHVDGKPTYFVEKIWKGLYMHHFDTHAKEHHDYGQKRIEKFGESIYVGVLDCPKIHTIREDKTNRWKKGNKIHFVIHNRTKDRFQFAPVIECTGVQKVRIMPKDKKVYIQYSIHRGKSLWKLPDYVIEDLAINDGFDSVEDFWAFFDKPFSGKIIHWTEYSY